MVHTLVVNIQDAFEKSLCLSTVGWSEHLVTVARHIVFCIFSQFLNNFYWRINGVQSRCTQRYSSSSPCESSLQNSRSQHSRLCKKGCKVLFTSLFPELWSRTQHLVWALFCVSPLCSYLLICT